jgi:signal transduction histidine kinase
MRRLVAERDERATRAAAAAITQNLHHLQSAVQSLSQRMENGDDPELIVRTSERFLSDFDAGMAILDMRGETLAASEPQPSWLTRVDLQRLVDSGAMFSAPYLDDGSSTVFVTATANEFAVIGAFSVQNLGNNALLSTMVTSEGTGVFLVDRSGSLLYYVGDRPLGADLLDHPGVSEGLRGETGSTFRQSEGMERVVAFSPISPTAWALVLEEPWRDVTSPVLDLSLLAPLALAPALLATLVALWFGARQVIRPLRELQAQAEQIARSSEAFEGGPVAGIAEIRNLQDSLIRMAQRISAAQRALQRYVGAITTAQEEERNRLARELHDETIQGLIAIDHRIQMLNMESEDADPDVVESLEQLHEQVNRAIAELRRMTKALRPIYLEDLGLVPAIEMLANDVAQDSGISVAVRLTGSARRLGREAELAIYRIMQEALSNISRHSQASSASLEIEYSEDRFEAVLEDDGQGFELPERSADHATKGHFGLMGMHERAELVGVLLDIHSEAGSGTRIRILLKGGSERPGTPAKPEPRQTA